MIDNKEFPTSDFVVDDIVARGHDRQAVVATLRKMEADGKGTFIIGRKGHKSRFEWSANKSAPTYDPTATSAPLGIIAASTPLGTSLVSWSQQQAEQHRKDLQNLANLMEFRGTATPVALYEHLSGLMQQLKQLRDGVTVEEPVGIEHVPMSWLQNLHVGFWTYEQRKAIANELLAYRKDKITTRFHIRWTLDHNGKLYKTSPINGHYYNIEHCRNAMSEIQAQYPQSKGEVEECNCPPGTK